MKDKRGLIPTALMTGAAFAGYNLGSGFATGMETLQFFGSWGAARGLLCLILAFAFSTSVLCVVFVTGQRTGLERDRDIYRFFGGRYFGAFLDIYVYSTIVIVAVTMISGAGATLNQNWGLPPYAGAALMGVVCVAASLLGLQKLQKVLGNICLIIIAFVVICWIAAMMKTGVGPVEGSKNIERYVADGSIMRISFLGIEDPVSNSLCAGGLLVSSGFAWAAVTGRTCSSKREALASGLFSSLFYYAATAIVFYLCLISTDEIAGVEIPLLAIVTRFTPALASAYSVIICLAVFSNITGRLYLLGERFGGGSRKRASVLSSAITLFAVVGGSFISFSAISNFLFTLSGTVGIVIGVVILVRAALGRKR